MAQQPTEETKTLGLFVTLYLDHAEVYANQQSSERSRPQPGVILYWTDKEIGRFLRDPRESKSGEAVIPFECFDQVPKPHKR